MAIREDLVASATQFLQDPSVASSTLDNRIAFLRTKNLTQEEIDAALTRAATGPSVPYAASSPVAHQYPPQPYPQYTWQQPAPPVPRRDWRDWFIMATVMGGVGYGLYTLTKRYVVPMIAPPTPERLEQDKQAIQDQFDKAFALVEQLAKDTEALKAAETERTQRLDGALAELETVLSDIKSSNRRRDDEAQRLRDDIYALKDSMPKAMDAQKDAVDSRLKEVNSELTSLKTLMSQRLGASSVSTGTGSYLRQSTGNAAPSNSLSASKTTTSGSENMANETTTASNGNEVKGFSGSGGQGRSSPFSPNAGKAAIPAWQLAMASKATGSNGADASSSSQSETADA